MVSSAELFSFDPSMEVAPTPKGGSADKVEKNKWPPLDTKGKFCEIPKSLLWVDRSYQREDNLQRVIQIASSFKWKSCGVVLVMRREDGKYLVVDGQHRVLAAWKRSDISAIPCLVFDSENVEAEANCFIDANTKRGTVTAFSKYRAKLVAKNQDALLLQNILAENGLILCKDGNLPNTITCIAACERIMRIQGEPAFRRSVALAAGLAFSDQINVNDMLLSGLAYLDYSVSDGLSNARLRARLLQVGGRALIDSARKMSFRAGVGGSKVWAQGMLEVANKGLHSKIKLKAE